MYITSIHVCDNCALHSLAQEKFILAVSAHPSGLPPSTPAPPLTPARPTSSDPTRPPETSTSPHTPHMESASQAPSHTPPLFPTPPQLGQSVTPHRQLDPSPHLQGGASQLPSSPTPPPHQMASLDMEGPPSIPSSPEPDPAWYQMDISGKVTPQGYRITVQSPLPSPHQQFQAPIPPSHTQTQMPQPQFQSPLPTAHPSLAQSQASFQSPSPLPQPQVHMPNDEVESVCPEPFPICQSGTSRALPSSEIKKDKLNSVEGVLAKYAALLSKGTSESNIRMLSVKLAKEAIFGEDVMVRCTPGGTRELPGLPTRELYELKKVLLSQFPQYWRCLHVFEAIWKKCRDAIEQACKRERRKLQGN